MKVNLSSRICMALGYLVSIMPFIIGIIALANTEPIVGLSMTDRGWFAGSMMPRAYADSPIDAAKCAIQHPTLLSRYAVRPPWQVAGVDYCVGVPGGVQLKDPREINLPGVIVNDRAGLVQVVGTSGVMLDGYDFTTPPGYGVVYTDSPNGTVRNSKFGPGRGINAPSSGSFTVEYCTFDQTGDTTSSTAIASASDGITTIRWNYFHNLNQHVVEIEPAAAANTYDFEYNMIDQVGGSVGAHINYGQMGGSSWSTLKENFNTIYQGPSIAGGEGFQWTNCCYGSITFAAPEFAYNTVVTVKIGGNFAITNILHVFDESHRIDNTVSPPGAVHDNYIDASGMYFNGGGWPTPFYPGSAGRGPHSIGSVVFRNNINMVNNRQFGTLP